MQIFEDSKSDLAGIGFVFTDDDPFVGVDLDHCLEPETGNLLPWVSEIVDLLDSYTEISPSGTGVKIILESSGMLPGRRKSSLGVEIYSSGRYFTITGHVFNEHSLIHKRTDQIQQIHKTLFPPSPTNTDSISKYAMGQQTASDEQILTRAKAAKNGWKFRQLCEGALSHHSGNASEADLSLCRILAFWCGPCPEQIDRIFRRSALFRPKWDEKHYGDGCTYGQGTVCKAIEAQEKENNFFKWRHGTAGIR
ncbi:hypothetical protein [Rubinisphaera sp.]|uniref:phage NrS-1 polymerase family protein n=1 Tax=Rubinisphaera sp. TaxID=2024857 RepID=UPI000C102309|nr:hypothetical protein [Rubinisphaera sp.]MBV08677.1 hypothetical protein [Rubinisphaera sp.]|tara:strand:- start:3540 stop:4292 length:753 start_codon:yes stop_codon:yes gene_type:complete